MAARGSPARISRLANRQEDTADPAPIWKADTHGTPSRAGRLADTSTGNMSDIIQATPSRRSSRLTRPAVEEATPTRQSIHSATVPKSAERSPATPVRATAMTLAVEQTATSAVLTKQAALKRALSNFRLSTPEFHARRESRKQGEQHGVAAAGLSNKLNDQLRKPLFPAEVPSSNDNSLWSLCKSALSVAPSPLLPSRALPCPPLSFGLKQHLTLQIPAPIAWLGGPNMRGYDADGLMLYSTTSALQDVLHQASAACNSDFVERCDERTAAVALSALTYYHCYPSAWWPEILLAATAGAAARLQTAVVKEWRDTATATAASRKKAAAATHAVVPVASVVPNASALTASTVEKKARKREKVEKTTSHSKAPRTKSPPPHVARKSAEALLAERVKKRQQERRADDCGASTVTSQSDTIGNEAGIKRPRSPLTRETPEDGGRSAKRSRADAELLSAGSEVSFTDADLDLVAAVLQSGWWDSGDGGPDVEDSDTIVGKASAKSADLTVSRGSLPAWWPGADSARAKFQSDYQRVLSSLHHGHSAPLATAAGVQSMRAAARKTVGLFGLGGAVGVKDAAGEKQPLAGTKDAYFATATTDQVSAPEVEEPVAQPKVLASIRPSDLEGAAEWTKRVTAWQDGLLSAWQCLFGALAPQTDLGLHNPWYVHPFFFIRFGPSEEAGNVILVCHARWLSTSGESSNTCCAVMARSSRSLRMRLRERDVPFSTPLDNLLHEFDLGGASLAASAEELQALNEVGESIKINDVDRVRAQQAIAMIEKTGVAPATMHSVKQVKNALRGTPSSSTSLLHFRDTEAVVKLLRCLLDSASPIPSRRVYSITSTQPPIPLSLYAVVDTNAIRGVKAVYPDKDVDVPQLLSLAPFSHSVISQLHVRQRTKIHKAGPMAAALQISGVLLPSVEEGVAAVLTWHLGVDAASEATVEREENLVTVQFSDPRARTGGKNDIL